MADLDDFFAKKDRKKSKKNFVTTDDLAKRLEESGRKSEKSKDKKLSQNADAGDERRPELKEEDEWKLFEEEEKKDYSNLKIQNLNIHEGVSGEDGQDDEEEGDGELEENEVGEMVPKRKVPTGPWKNVAAVEPEPEPIQHAKPIEQFGSGGGSIEKGAYVPPSLRSRSSVLQHQPGSRTKSKQAPDITNEAYFPTLNAAKNPQPDAGPWSRRLEATRKREENVGFEEVRSSRSNSNRYEPPKISSASQGPKLVLGNKFDVLQDRS